MFRVCVYKGYGMYDKDGIILHRVLSKYVCAEKYTVSFITPEEICAGSLNSETSLFVIGGGFDLGLIKALGAIGMSKIKDYVMKGGSYLGICSGAYFACDHIEFDQGGPLEVTGERFLKFYPGHSYGPLYKTYDYQTRSGAVSCQISVRPDIKVSSVKNGNLQDENISGLRTSQDLQSITSFDKYGYSKIFKVYFNGGGLFLGRNQNVTLSKEGTYIQPINMVKNGLCQDDKNLYSEAKELGFENVTVLARYDDLDSTPAAIVKCKVGKGIAVLSGPHFEYETVDIDDGDPLVKDIIEQLKESYTSRQCLMLSILKDLRITTQESL